MQYIHEKNILGIHRQFVSLYQIHPPDTFCCHQRCVVPLGYGHEQYEGGVSLMMRVHAPPTPTI